MKNIPFDKYIKNSFNKWVNENFGEFTQNDTAGSTEAMSSNCNNTGSSGALPFSVNNIDGEDLKKSFGGVRKFKELKQQADDLIRDIKSSIIDCESKEATASSYSKLIDLLNKPEIISVLEHIKEELKLREQNEGRYAK